MEMQCCNAETFKCGNSTYVHFELLSLSIILFVTNTYPVKTALLGSATRVSAQATKSTVPMELAVFNTAIGSAQVNGGTAATLTANVELDPPFVALIIANQAIALRRRLQHQVAQVFPG